MMSLVAPSRSVNAMYPTVNREHVVPLPAWLRVASAGHDEAFLWCDFVLELAPEYFRRCKLRPHGKVGREGVRYALRPLDVATSVTRDEASAQGCISVAANSNLTGTQVLAF